MDNRLLLRLKFVCGEPLAPLALEYKKYTESLTDYRQSSHWTGSIPLQQAIENLMGGSTNPKVLKGSIMDVDDLLPKWEAAKNHQAVFECQFYTMLLSYHFGDYDVAALNIKGMPGSLFGEGPHYLVLVRVLYTCLTYTALFKQKRKRKYIRRAKAALKPLKKWSKDGAINAVHMVRLIEADLMACSCSTKTEVLGKFDDAIHEINRLGLQQQLALANELAGEFCFRTQSMEDAKRYLSSAMSCCYEWGAEAKLSDIQSRFSDLF